MNENEELLPLVSPGDLLLEEFLNPNGLTQKQLAEAIGIPASRVNELIKGRLRISGDLAIRLSSFFGNSVQFWLNAQAYYDYEKAEREHGDEIRASVHPLAS